MAEANDGSTGVALVTGAGSGLGRAFARELVDAGFVVAGLGRRRDALEETVSGLPDGAAVGIVADVTDEASVERAVRDVVERWGRIDVLVNNAGAFGPTGLLDEVGLDDIRSTLEVNVLGAVICSRAVLPVMRAQRPAGGRIINNGSVSAQVPRPQAAAYAMSKCAMTGLTRSLALECRPFGIAVGQIDIGNAETDMSGFMTDALQPDGSRRAEPTFAASDAARAVRLMATLPLEANVLSLTIAATGMPLIGRG